MRKLPVVAVASVLLLAACGDDSSVSSDRAGTTTAPAASETTVASSAGPATAPTTVPRSALPKPSVAPPATAPTELVVTDLKDGTGEPATTGDVVVVHYVGVRSVDGVEFDNSYDRGEPFPVTLGEGSVIQGWEQGLLGARAGGQRRLDIPSELAYGPTAKGDVIRADEDLTFVVDVLAVVKPAAATDEPALSIAPSVAVPEIVPVDLVEGTGAVAEAGAMATFRYIFYRADTGEKLYSSWGQDAASLQLVPDGSVDAIVEGVIGMKVGGRRQLTIPSRLVFGGAGNSDMGLPAGTDLVAVIDLVATY